VIENHGEAELEAAAIQVFEKLGWAHINAYGETFPASMLGRETPAEVVLTQRLRPTLQKLNPELPADALDEAVEALLQPRHLMRAVAANREVYDLLKDGVRVETRTDEGGIEIVTVRLIDWSDPDNNDYLLVSQFKVAGDMYNRRTDLLGFVNGIPLVLVEFKAPHEPVKKAYDRNLTDYKNTIPHLFWYNASIILSNGISTKVGSVTAFWEHFADWKRIASEDEAPQSSIEAAIRGTCDRQRLLDLLESFTLFMEVTGGQIKILAKNHQYLGVNNAIEAVRNLGENRGRLGVFWHTQGAGKSISMIFFSQKLLRKIPGNWSFLIVTDRKELDEQIYGNFASSGVITEPEPHAESGEHLKQLLREDHRYMFTLIHKFGMEKGQSYPLLTERKDLIVMADEAHRTQYDTLATNMRSALPNAAFIAFTGTPLIAGEERTREVFGDYVSVYDFRQSIDDGATVPLFYENRIPELQIINPDFSKAMEEILERAALDESEEARFAHNFAREYHLITRDDRLNTIAEDISDHFLSRGQQGKAMVVSVDKATAVRIFDKVKASWARRLDQLRREEARATGSEKEALQEHIRTAEAIDMAVVVSQSQNEVEELAAKGVDIVPHRKRMNDEDLATRFKDADDPLSIVFVCAMWMTGFDAPALSTLYLDKPMRNHTLMQTIARANRVFPGKVSGELIDYIGVFRNLQKALAIYAAGPKGTELPVQDKEAQAEELRAKIDEVKAFLEASGVALSSLIGVSKLDWVLALEDARDKLVVNDLVRSTFLHLVTEASKLWKALKPHPAAAEAGEEMWAIVRLAQAIQSLAGPVDVTSVMAEVEALLEESIAAEPYLIESTADKRVDLSEIDFEALAQQFSKGHQNTAARRLRDSVERKVTDLLRLNPTRIDYAERLQEMIDRYNAGSANIEEFFEQLKLFAQELTQEQQRAVAESLSEEELALLDLLTKPEPKLTKAQETEVKKVVRDLLDKLKRGLLVLDWKKRQQTRAAVQVAIQDELDRLPVVYDAELYRRKCVRVFEHVFEAYQGDGRSIYEEAAA
jgi:type I restriction enzyme R subunit